MGKFLGCIGCIGCLGLLIGVTLLVVGFFGFVPAITSFVGFDKPRDLGISYTEEDSKNAQKKSGDVQMIELPSSTSFAESFRLEGTKRATFTMDSTEVSALMSHRPWKYWPLENVQVRMNIDGSVEASALVNAEKLLAYTEAIGFKTQDVKDAMNTYHIPFRNLPAYAKGRGSVTNDKVTLSLESVTVGPVPIPGSVIAGNTGRVVDVIETALGRIQQNNQITSLTFENGMVKFDGMVPQKEYVVMK